MNTNNGNLIQILDNDFTFNEDLIPIDMSDATEKQKTEMQVSKYDNISTLGKIFTGNRKERREQAKQLKRELCRKK